MTTPNTNDYPMPLNETPPIKISAYAADFNAETKEKSSGTCEHVIQNRKENSMQGY